MRFRIGSALLCLLLAASLTAVASAQAVTDMAAVEAVADQTDTPMLFVQLTVPAETDIEVPLNIDHLLVQGLTVPGSAVSVDGDLADVDDGGNFADVAVLSEGANAIDVVASDDQGNQVTTTLYVVRGE